MTGYIDATHCAWTMTATSPIEPINTSRLLADSSYGGCCGFPLSSSLHIEDECTLAIPKPCVSGHRVVKAILTSYRQRLTMSSAHLHCVGTVEEVLCVATQVTMRLPCRRLPNCQAKHVQSSGSSCDDMTRGTCRIQ